LRPRLVALLALLALGLFGRPAGAEAHCSRLYPWSRVGSSLGHFVEPWPLGLVGFSPLPLLASSPTGADHALRLAAQKNLGGRYHLEPVSFVTPYALAGGVAIADAISIAVGSCALERPLSAILQGMGGGLIATVALKWSVGREWPNAGHDPHAPDRLSHPVYAERFHPFRLTLGAWPSGHTLSMFAAAAAFRAADYEIGWWRFAGYPVAAAVGVGMWLGDRHWASDVLSGALLGEAIGSSVGAAFARAEDAPAGTGQSAFVALPVPGGMLAAWTGTW
jgi:membrane-associated phospholipid phosphatase